MKKILRIAFVLITGISHTLPAQKNNSLLWEISGNGLRHPSYLQGTFHMMCLSDFQLKSKTTDALEKAQRLVLEIDYTDPEEIAAMQKMMQAEKKLSAQLSPEEAKELNEVLKSYGTSLEAVDSFSPQALYLLVGQKAVPCPQAEVRYFEMELLTLAMKNGKAIGGLEHVADQTLALAQAYDLKEAIRQLKAGEEYAAFYHDIIQAFKEENAEELDKLIRDERFMSEEQTRWILTDRNKNWAMKAMPAMMQKESVLFAVGNGHLWGEKGVIELLKAQGYTVKPVK